MYYYVNKNAQPTGEHEVHKNTCGYLKKTLNKQYLGSFSSCKEALVEAKKHFSNVDGCAFCCPKCHTK